jgi:hypothetical protein
MKQEPIRLMKKTIYNSEYSMKVYDCNNNNSDSSVEVNRNMKTLHTTAVERYLESRTPNKILNTPAPKVNETERTLDRGMRRTLAQLRAGKCPMLREYLNKIDESNYPTPSCPLCQNHTHNAHLFRCAEIPTSLQPEDLWNKLVEVSQLISVWQNRLGAPEGGGPGRHSVE